MRDSNDENVKSRGARMARRFGTSETLDMPKPLSRKGYVVWFHDHCEYLGLAWNESAQEIERAHVANADHAIYFETFAQAAVASDKFISPCRVLHSPGPGKRPKLMP
ncbi:hypothetical protein [Pandoraea cepalis]|nr:hypothetical protein [Pandoraea cepalis]